MLKKKIFIPIVVLVVLTVVGYSLWHGRKVAIQEPVKSNKPVEVETPVAAPKPPPGETAESGHWHGDEWHSETHDTATETPSTVEVNQRQPQPPPSVIAEGNPPANPKQETSEKSARTRTPQEEAEIQRQWRAWSEWSAKHRELREKVSQAWDASSALVPKTAEEAERYQTDKEWQRKAQETTDQWDEALGELQEHEANRVVPPAQFPKER